MNVNSGVILLVEDNPRDEELDTPGSGAQPSGQ